jgi:asparagine synthase (glutamine-hydrolysing)
LCGIAGVICNSMTHLNFKNFLSMVEKIDRRGPDGKGILTNNKNFAIGGTRLAITGPDNMPIPLTDQSNRFALVYNGEIYDLFLDEGVSDTNYLLNKLINGKMHKNLNGMYAFAFVDLRDMKTVLGRDKFGIKPLYYYLNKNTLQFSSDINSLVQYDRYDVEIDSKALFEYLTFGRRIGEETVFKNVFSLEPGTLLKISMDSDELICTTQKLDTEKEALTNDELLSALKNSILECAKTSRTLGVFLSGGVDSLAIVYTLAEYGIENIHTFSLILEGDGVKRLEDLELPGTSWKTWTHHTLNPSMDMIEDTFINVLNITSEPCFPMSAIYTFLLSKMASDSGVKVVLSGEGADELFLGYESYVKFFKQSNRNPLTFYLNNNLINVLHGLIEEGHNYYECIENQLTNILDNEDNIFLGLSLLEQHLSLRPLLDRIDQTSMYHSIEVRVPFLHGEVPLLAKKLLKKLKPQELNITKPNLRKILQPLLKEKAMNIPKKPLRINLKQHFARNNLKEILDILQKEVKSFFPVKEKGLYELIDRLSKNPTESDLGLALRLYQLYYYINKHMSKNKIYISTT